MRFWLENKYNLSMKLIYSLLLLSSTISLFSCAKKSTVNQGFEEQYGKAVEMLRQQRAEPLAKPQKQEEFVVKKNDDWRDNDVKQDNYYPYMNADGLDNKKPMQQFLPDAQTFNSFSNQDGKALPDDMFIISYNTENHPQFKKIGVEFDAIDLPDEDFYNVKTEASDKSYLVIDNSILQKDISQIKQAKSAVDVENSKILIAEYKQKEREEDLPQALIQKEATSEAKKQEKSNLKKQTKKQNKKPTNNLASFFKNHLKMN